ncbi:MAG: ABC transporter ATP-binding protein [Lachnospiraceae bacterium]|nr:ABC transporter ATP-binding protein [Lachnospiraceae bacterium]
MPVNSFREDEDQKQVVKRQTIIRLFRYMVQYQKQVAGVLGIMAVTTAISLLNPLIIERAVDVHVANGDWKRLLLLGAGAVVLNLILMFGIKLRIRMMAQVTNRVLQEIREELYTHIQELGFDFFDSRPTGKILSRIVSDVNALREVLDSAVITLLPELCVVISVMVIMLLKNAALALSAILILPLLLVGVYVVQILAHKKWQIVRKKGSNMNAFVHENLSGIRVVQSFCAEEEEEETYHQLVEEHMQAFANAIYCSDAFQPVIEVSWGIGTCLLYLIGIRYLGAEQVGVGTFLAFSTYLGMFWNPIQRLGEFYNKIITNLAGAERIFEILDIPADITDKEKAEEMPPVKGEVTFDHVSFAYANAPEVQVLRDVSFTVKPGQTIALVGPTGAGKSTIVNLVSRFYDVTEGSVRIDGTDVRDVTLHSLRSQMGVMTQENFLFTGTVRDNILYGNPEATEEEMIQASKAVHAHEYIMKLPDGYDTKISERGGSLSAGQRQLIAFARAMLSMPAILVLDEATASIDTHTELLVQQGIEGLLEGRTSFVVAHRLSTIRKADCIFVIDDGMIKEAGSHAQLMEQQGAYYRLYQAQFSV